MTVFADRGSFTRLLVTAAAGVVILAGMKAAGEIVNIVGMAFFFGIVLMPLFRWLIARTGQTRWAIVILFVLVVVFGLAMGLFLVYSAFQVADSVEAYGSSFGQSQAGVADQVAQYAPQLASALQSALSPDQAAAVLGGFAKGLVNAVANAVIALFIMLFFLSEAPALMDRLARHLGHQHPVVRRTSTYAEQMITYFMVRTKLNLITGVGITLLLAVLGVDYALLWGVLAFFLSYVPYIGLILATIPGMILAFAEFGLGRAVLVVVGILIWNLVIENVFQPAMTGKELSLSPTFVFVMFLLWSFILGPVGSFLAMPITIAAVLAMDTFDDSRWLAGLFGLPARLPGEALGEVPPDEA